MTRPVVDHWSLATAERHRVERELAAGEEILWIGQPSARRAGLMTLPILLFAIPWTGFAVFWIVGAAGFKMPNFTSASSLFPLFGVPFVLVGLGMMAAPLLAVRAARRTVYVITDQRAIVLEAQLASSSTRSYPPETFDTVERRERKDGSGDLIFEKHVSKDDVGSTSTRVSGFRGIPNVRDVDLLLREVRELNRVAPFSGSSRSGRGGDA